MQRVHLGAHMHQHIIGPTFSTNPTRHSIYWPGLITNSTIETCRGVRHGSNQMCHIALSDHA